MMTELTDIPYFAVKRTQQPPVFALAERVQLLSAEDPENYTEFDRRLRELLRVPEPYGEQRRQSVNFLAEMVVFNEVAAAGNQPRWVPEGAFKVPDIIYRAAGSGLWVPIEVKHLNAPRDEDIAMMSGGPGVGGTLPADKDYERFLERKVCDFMNQTDAKFQVYSGQHPGEVADHIVLRMLFSQSIEAENIDSVRGQLSMGERIDRIVADNIGGRPMLVGTTRLNDHFPHRGF